MDSENQSQVIVYQKHPLVIRWTHWVNFPLMTLMIVSGLMIYWANTAYTMWIPDSWWEAVHLNAKLAFGMGIHFFFMWIFLVNGLLYVSYLLITGSWRELVPKLSSFRDALQVTLHDLGIRKGLPRQGKFNGGQRIAYTAITLLGGLQIFTGLVIFKPVQLQALGVLMGGYEGARLIHFIATILFMLFFLVHLAQVLRAGWNNFRSMVTGVEEIQGDEIQVAQGLDQ